MIGFWSVKSFEGDTDARGFKTSVWCASERDDRIEAMLYLPPYLRQSQCGIDVGSILFGIVDNESGIGVALYGECDADFGYFFDADIVIKQKLEVVKAVTMDDKLDVIKDITTTTGDVTAGSVTLKTHTHQITLMTQPDVASLATSVLAGGTTPVAFTAFYTITPQ